jgi:hypothetical protein
VEAKGRGAGDPVIDLRDAAGNLILSDDDSGGGGAAFAESYLAPGTYCLSMRSYDGSPMTGFVRVGRLEHDLLTEPVGSAEVPPYDSFDGGGTCDLARVTASIGNGPIDALLSAGGATATASVNETPYWGFTLAAPAAISITAANENADPLITIYDQNGNWLAENDDFDGLNSRVDFTTPLQPGRYCIAMRALSDPSLPITLSITGYDPRAALTAMYERGEASPPLDGSYPVTRLGTLGPRLRQDIQSTSVTSWFAVEIPVAGLLLVEAVTNGMGDPVLVLFDDFGRKIAYNDDFGEGLDSQVTARVLPGTYLVGVRQLSSGEQALTRVLFERYVPAQ